MHQLADVIRMAMYTGARREELCSLKVEHVKGDRAAVGRQQPLLTLTKRSIEADIEPICGIFALKRPNGIVFPPFLPKFWPAYRRCPLE